MGEHNDQKSEPWTRLELRASHFFPRGGGETLYGAGEQNAPDGAGRRPKIE